MGRKRRKSFRILPRTRLSSDPVSLLVSSLIYTILFVFRTLFNLIFCPRRVLLRSVVSGNQVVITYERVQIPQRLRYELIAEAGGRCTLCGASPNDGYTHLHIDYIIPVALGGTNEKRNLRVLCDKCNLGKGKRHLI